MLSLEYSQYCLDLLSSRISAGAVGAFFPDSKLTKEIICTSANQIAWGAYIHETDKENLEDAIKKIDLAINYSDTFFYHDTKVRLLLKLGRTEEAYKIISEVLIEDSSYDEFDDIKNSDEFTEYQSKLFEITDEEKAFLKNAKEIFENINLNVIPKDANKENNFEVEFTNDVNWSDEIMIVVKGDLYVEDIDEWVEEQEKKHKKEIFSVQVNGNLYINDYYDTHLQVKGNMYVNSFYQEYGHVDIDGDLIVATLTQGEYPQGSLNVEGRFESPYVKYMDHDMPEASDINCISMEGFNDKSDIRIEELYDYDDINLSYRLFKPEVWDEDGCFDMGNFCNLITDGINPFIEP